MTPAPRKLSGSGSVQDPAKHEFRPDTIRLDQIIDSEPEPAFDDIARLAAHDAECPIAVVSLVAPAGHWLKSRIGLSPADFPLALLFAEHVLSQGEMLVIEDSHSDRAFGRHLREHARDPAGLPVRFLAGIPLRDTRRKPQGTLCVFDREARKLRVRHATALQTLARQVLTQIDVRRILAELSQAVGEARRAELAQRESEERFRELFENANDIVYTHDLDENFTSLNRAGEVITGYSRADILQMKIHDVLAPEHLAVAREMMNRKVAGEPPRIYEVEILGKDRRRIPLELSTRVLRENGKPAGIQGIARDVSERRQAATALQTANQKLSHWVRDLQERNRDHSLLRQMNNLVQSCETSAEACASMGRAFHDLFPDFAGAVALFDAERKFLETVASWGEPVLPERVFLPEECWSLRRSRSHWVDNPTSDPVCKHLGRPETGTFLCTPLMVRGDPLGVLHLQCGTPGRGVAEPVRLPDSTQRLADSAAGQLALSLANLRLREELRGQSIRDALTGLFNRRYLEEVLDRELRRACRKQTALGLVMLDVDHFKSFNDTFGHEAGDSLLRDLGQFLQSQIRHEDIACRYGGEEFTVILPDATPEVARLRSGQWREAYTSRPHEFRGQPLGLVTLSFGVASCPVHGSVAGELLRAADLALYQAKSEGRDCVRVASTPQRLPALDTPLR